MALQAKLKYTQKQVFAYAISILDDNRDSIGDVNLTAVEEDVQDHFDMTDKDFEDGDWSYRISEYLSEQGYVA